MLTERVLTRTASQLKELGWNDSEVDKALSIMGGDKKAINIAMPKHFKMEAIQHAKCTCEYKLGLSPNSPKYEKHFKKAYKQYLTDAWLNSKGIEGDDDVKRGNPAGIEVDVFSILESEELKGQELIKNKSAIKKKAAAGIVFMGKDRWLQRSIANVYKNLLKRGLTEDNAKQLVKDIMTQYSAAVTSLGNTFLYAFGNYNTKRKFSGVPIYDQVDGKLTEPASALEFDKVGRNATDEQKRQLREVTYRQMTRQIYLFLFSTIVAGTTAIDAPIINNIYKSVEKLCDKLWKDQCSKNPELNKDQIPLAFLLQKNVRDLVLQQFYDFYSPRIMYYKNQKAVDEGRAKGVNIKGIPNVRQIYLEEIIGTIKEFLVYSDSTDVTLDKTIYTPSKNKFKTKSNMP